MKSGNGRSDRQSLPGLCRLTGARTPRLAGADDLANPAGAAARAAARELLAWITDTQVDAPVQVWRDWFAAHQDVRLKDLLPVVPVR